MIYGYCRISRKEQNIDRQERNIKAKYEKAIIIKEAFTGTKIDRPFFDKLLKKVKAGDTIVFDSVSRMSRNADEGVQTYFELYEKGVNLIFLNERHVDTDSYCKALKKSGIDIDLKADTAENTLVNDIVCAINRFMRAKVADDIIKAFEQAEKEVEDLHQRTREGIETARLNGKQIGAVAGVKLTTKKSISAKEQILKLSQDFNGTNSDAEVMKIVGLARNTYYKYKRELKAETTETLAGQKTVYDIKG